MPSESSTAWSSADGRPCDDLDPCTTSDKCTNASCQGSWYSCDDNLACTTDVCLGNGSCTNGLKQGYCFIDGKCRAVNEHNPDNGCEKCDPAMSDKAWSFDDGIACDDSIACTYGDKCLRGACHGTAYTCDDAITCTDDTCTGEGPGADGCSFVVQTGRCLTGTVCSVANNGRCPVGARCTTSNDCEAGICFYQKCRYPMSCNELHTWHPQLPDGAYTIDPDDSGPNPSAKYYCDMTTDGGGWTALLNPAGNASLPNAYAPGLAVSTAIVFGTYNTCPPDPAFFVSNGWNGVRAYACGDSTLRMTISWPNPIRAHDIMFIATVQGETFNSVDASSIGIGYDAATYDHGTCEFWNASKASVVPASNECWKTTLDVPPHVYPNEISFPDGDVTVRVNLLSGPACKPSCSYGTGMNIQKLFVR